MPGDRYRADPITESPCRTFRNGGPNHVHQTGAFAHDVALGNSRFQPEMRCILDVCSNGNRRSERVRNYCR